MRYKTSKKILIDKRKLETLIRLGCDKNIIWEVITTEKFTKTGDELIDENLESLIDNKTFYNWGGSRQGAGRKPKNQVENLNSLNTAENLEENQVENQDSNQNPFQVGDKDKDKDIDRDIYNINTKEKENIYIKEKEIPEREESIVIQDSIFTQDNNTPLENNNTVNARQGNEYNGKESKSSDISREKAIANWNRIASNYGLCEIRTITDTRFSKLKSRVKQAGGWQEFWNIVNEAIQESKFLRGEKGWKADFDFCLQPSSFVKLMEKTYK